MIVAVFIYLCLFVHDFAKDMGLPAYLHPDPGLSSQLAVIIQALGLDGDFDVGEDGTEQISLAVIDLAKRENINALIHAYKWDGSEVTRKFLSRRFEDPGYEKIRGTETCAQHAADFLYLIETNRLVNPWVSMQLKSLLARQLDDTKYASGLPPNTMFYHKTGWYSFWTNDAGIVDDGHTRYIIACFLPLKEEEALPKFRILASKIHHLIRERQHH